MPVGKDGSSWYYVFDGPPHQDGRRNRIKRRGFDTKKAALAAEREHMRKFDELPKNANGRTIKEFLEDIWLPQIETLGYKRSMIESYRRDSRLHIIPRIGNVALVDIDGSVIDNFYAALTQPGADRRSKIPKPLSGKTISNIHGTLSKALSVAVRHGMMKHNPCKDAVRTKVVKPKVVPLRWDEVSPFLGFWAGQPEAPAIEFALLTGLRRGELLGLRWQDVRWERSRIFVEHTLLSVDYEILRDAPKTDNSHRWVPLVPRAVEILREQYERRTGSEFVFTDLNGNPFHPDLFSQKFSKRMRHWEGTKITVHGLRHTFATLSLTRMGMKMEALSTILGHYSTAFTADVYTHWRPDDLDDAMGGWANATSGPPVAVAPEPTVERLTPERLREAVTDARSIKVVVERLGLAVSNRTYARVVAMAEREGIPLPKAASGRKKVA